MRSLDRARPSTPAAATAQSGTSHQRRRLPRRRTHHPV